MILVVDDEPMVRELVSTVLQKEGFSVSTAASGAEAMSIAQAHRGEIELVITDVVMPGMDGRTLARELVADNPKIPILFISGQCDAAELGEYGQWQFLAKPFSLAILVLEVRKLMRRASLQTVS